MSNNHIGLGKGLSAILGEIEEETPENSTENGIQFIDINKLSAGRFQPRHQFKEEELADLVSSIREKGVLQPLLVRPQGVGYEIIAGERRWRASQQAGLTQVPVIIKNFNDEETLEVALVENLQRQDLNPLEEALGFERLMKEFNRTQEELAKVVGKSRSYVANTLRLLELSEKIKEFVENGLLTAGHARALLNAKNPDKLAQKVIDQGLSVRQTEQLAVSEGEKKTRSPKTVTVGQRKDTDVMALEAELSKMLHTSVSVRWTGKNGKVTIMCPNLETLDTVLERLTRGGEVGTVSEN